MSRNRTPANILELRGAYKKDPQRKPEAAPENPNFKPRVPRHLDKRHRAVWLELVHCVQPGVLQRSDYFIVEQATMLLCEMRAQQAEFPASRHQTLISCLSRLGMTPADRTRVAIPKTSTNKFQRSAAKRA